MAVTATNPLTSNVHDTKISEASAQYNAALQKAMLTGSIDDIRVAREAAETVQQLQIEKEIEKQKTVAESAEFARNAVQANQAPPPPKPKVVSTSVMPDEWYE